MPEFIGWEIDTLEKLEAAEFDDPRDRRRYFSAGDNQIAGVGDGFERNSPPWVETVKSLWPDFPVYGSMIECRECMTRLIGPQNHMLWMALEPERMGAVINRVGAVLPRVRQGGDRRRPGRGSTASSSGATWPTRKARSCGPTTGASTTSRGSRRSSTTAHAHGLTVIYHGCGNVKAIFEDYIETGIDAYNPLEVKAGMDVLDLRRRFGHRMAFCGNSDIQVWENRRPRGDPPRGAAQAQCGPRRRLHLPVRPLGQQRRLRAARTTTSSKLVREYGQYPLQLGEFDEAT